MAMSARRRSNMARILTLPSDLLNYSGSRGLGGPLLHSAGTYDDRPGSASGRRQPEDSMLLSRLAAAAFALAAIPAFAQEITLKVAHFWPPNAMPPSTLLVPWCDKVAKDSNNRLKCQIYPAKDGVADIVWTLPGYTAGRYPMMEVFELPFMSATAEPTSQAAWEYYD